MGTDWGDPPPLDVAKRAERIREARAIEIARSVAMQTTLERIRDLPCDAPRLAADVLDALGRR